MIIRQEKPEEYNQIYLLIKTAFETAKVADGDEQDFAASLRKSSGYIPQLALVADNEGELIGHIMLTRIFIQGDDKQHQALLLAPICVKLAYRNQGVGGKLISESFRIAREMGYPAVFLCGDPAYYSRFGFRQVDFYGIKNASEIPDQYVMCCALEPDGLRDKTGSVSII